MLFFQEGNYHSALLYTISSKYKCIDVSSFQKLLEELENEDLDIPAHIREARFGELRKQAAEFEGMRDREHGVYRCVHPGDICIFIFRQYINIHIDHH